MIHTACLATTNSRGPDLCPWEPPELKVDGRRITMSHFRVRGDGLACDGSRDVAGVSHTHTHQSIMCMVHSALVQEWESVEIFGWFGRPELSPDSPRSMTSSARYGRKASSQSSQSGQSSQLQAHDASAWQWMRWLALVYLTTSHTTRALSWTHREVPGPLHSILLSTLLYLRCVPFCTIALVAHHGDPIPSGKFSPYLSSELSLHLKSSFC